MSGNQSPHPAGVVPSPAPQGAPAAVQAPASPSADADIAAFLAEGHTSGDEEKIVTEPEDSSDEDDEEESSSDDDDEDDQDEDDEEESSDDDDDEPKPTKKEKFKPDPKALAAAVEKGDLPALLKAMGPAAEKMLSSKAHATLRMQAKELAKKEQTAKATETRVADLSTKLGEKYADPIAARKAAAEGNADAFVELVEKWGGYEWNAMVKWVANSAAGRPARLEEKSKNAEKETKVATAKREQAVAEAKSWIETGLNKADAKLVKACPEAVDLCLDVIRDQRIAGIDTPKKALPVVVKRLREQHARLSKYFGTSAVEGKKGKRAQVAATKAGRAEEENTDNMSVAEMISSHVKSHGGSRRRGV